MWELPIWWERGGDRAIGFSGEIRAGKGREQWCGGEAGCLVGWPLAGKVRVLFSLPVAHSTPVGRGEAGESGFGAGRPAAHASGFIAGAGVGLTEGWGVNDAQPLSLSPLWEHRRSLGWGWTTSEIGTCGFLTSVVLLQGIWELTS